LYNIPDQTRVDFLQLMVNAEAEAERGEPDDDESVTTTGDNGGKANPPAWTQKGIC
jgi:hypothetical protein